MLNNYMYIVGRDSISDNFLLTPRFASLLDNCMKYIEKLLNGAWG